MRNPNWTGRASRKKRGLVKNWPSITEGKKGTLSGKLFWIEWTTGSLKLSEISG